MPIQDVAIRLLLAMIIGGIIGSEREHYNRPAGFRTHILVCTGAAVISLIQVTIVYEAIEMVAQNSNLSNIIKTDFGRMGAQVISGVGFLGAGTILHQKGSVTGLTTAASLWNSACLGLAVGMGYYSIAILGAIACMVVLALLTTFQDKLFRRTGPIKVVIKYKRKKKDSEPLEHFFTASGISVLKIDYQVVDSVAADENIMTCQYKLVLPKHLNSNMLLGQVATVSGVISVSLLQE